MMTIAIICLAIGGGYITLFIVTQLLPEKSKQHHIRAPSEKPKYESIFGRDPNRSSIEIDRSIFYGWPKKFPRTYIVFDLETTGLNYSSDYIAQIAAIKVQDGKIIDQFSNYVAIPVPMPKRASEINGITDSILQRKGIPERSALKQMNDFSENLPIFSYNVPFDGSFYLAACKRAALPVDNNFYCILRFCRSTFTLNSYKLADVINQLQLSKHKAHDALGDTLMANDVLVCGQKKIEAHEQRLIKESGPIPFDKEPLLVNFNQPMFFIGCNKKTEELATKLGASLTKSTTLKTKYLVIGAINPAWKYSGHFKNIDKARNYRDERKIGLSIIHERYLVKCALKEIQSNKAAENKPLNHCL